MVAQCRKIGHQRHGRTEPLLTPVHPGGGCHSHYSGTPNQGLKWYNLLRILVQESVYFSVNLPHERVSLDILCCSKRVIFIFFHEGSYIFISPTRGHFFQFFPINDHFSAATEKGSFFVDPEKVSLQKSPFRSKFPGN